MATAPLNIGGAFPDMADGGMADEGHNSDEGPHRSSPAAASVEKERRFSKSTLASPSPHEPVIQKIASQATTAFLTGEITYQFLCKMKRVVVKDYDLFMDAVLTLFERPLKWSILKRLINKMIVQKDKIWDLCELLDRHRPFLRKGMCDTFPTNPSKHDAEGYTVQTGEQHLLNHQLLQKLETITTTFWRKGPAPKKRVSKPAKRSKSYLQQAKITPRAHGPRKLIPPEAFCDLSESDDPGYETIEDEDEEGGEDEKDEDEEGEDEEGEDEEGEDEVIAEEEE